MTFYRKAVADAAKPKLGQVKNFGKHQQMHFKPNPNEAVESVHQGYLFD
jgi:hypothetical protein